jgi:hypothetical protein
VVRTSFGRNVGPTVTTTSKYEAEVRS